MSSKDLPDLTEQIKTAMSVAGLNMTQLAERSGIPYRTLQKYLSGEHRVPSAALPGLADVLDVSIDWLMTGEPAAMHPRPLLIAVDQLHQFINTRPPRPEEKSPPIEEFAAQLYLAYRRHYLARFAEGSIGVAMSQDGPPAFLRRLYGAKPK
jgi:transcriptional regulator with XRE-family HTH domain